MNKVNCEWPGYGVFVIRSCLWWFTGWKCIVKFFLNFFQWYSFLGVAVVPGERQSRWPAWSCEGGGVSARAQGKEVWQWFGGGKKYKSGAATSKKFSLDEEPTVGKRSKRGTMLFNFNV